MLNLEEKVWLSVVIPVYNTEQYLKRCVFSITNQNTNGVQIILVDDGSKDKSGDLCDELSNNHENITVIHQTNQGLSVARNNGLIKAKGEYVLFVDSDDFLENDCLQIIKSELSISSKCDVYQFNTNKYVERQNIKKQYNKVISLENAIDGKTYLKQTLPLGLTVTVWSYLYRRDFLIEQNLWFKPGVYHEDEEFTVRVLLKAGSVTTIENTLYDYCIRPSSITTKRNQEKNANDLLENCDILKPIFNSVDDIELRSLLLNKLVSMNLTAFMLGYRTNKSFKSRISTSFLIENAYTRSNRIKSIIYKISPQIFYNCENLFLKLRGMLNE